MRPLAFPLAIVLLLLGGCGDRESIKRAGPLGPELYEIAEDDRPAPGAFLRFAPPGPRGGGLDIAMTDYEHPEGLPPVSLVGVVHVADPPYYERLQTLLESYDLVLYEAVKPADLDVRAWQEDVKDEMRAFDEFQRQLVSWFGFAYQLDALDYGRFALAHADMTLEEFRAEGGDQFFPNLDPDASTDRLDELPEQVRKTLGEARALAEVALGKPGPLRSFLRRAFAETMGTTDIGDTLDMIPGLTDLLLVRRNEVAMAKFVEVLPDITGRVAVFYGAAHMPDLEKRVLDLGYVRTTGTWLRAWALRAPLKR